MNLLGWYANWSGSKVLGMMELMCALTRLSKRLIVTDVNAIERHSLFQVTLEFLGTGTMVICLKHVGITHWDWERWKMFIKTPASWSTHALRSYPGFSSGQRPFEC